MILQEIISNLKGAKTVDELLTAEVQALYMAEPDAVRRASAYGELREIAKKNNFLKPFDKAFPALNNSVKEYAKAAASEQAGAVSIDSVAAALDDLGIVLRYNQLTKEAEVTGLPPYYSTENAANVLPVYLMDFLRECGFSGVTQQTVDGCLACIADRNRYNPIREYLQAGTWDGTDRFPEIYRILGVEDPIYQTFIRKWFIQSVALGLNDEGRPVGADGILVLQGDQGIAKTSFFRAITPFHEWFVEGAVLDMKDKDTLINSLSGWITELGELDSTLKKEQMSIKAFITKPSDKIRAPYARTPARTARRTSFCGTVNPKNYLKDETGSRRFWTVPVEYIDKKTLFSLRPEWLKQLWLQVYRMYQLDPCSFRLTDEEREWIQKNNREFEIQLSYEPEIRALLDYSLPVDCWEWWRSVDLAERLPGKPDSRPVGKALAKIAKEFDGVSGYKDNYRRVSTGPEYLIPVQHYNQNWANEIL